jgi:hypothetical protein
MRIHAARMLFWRTDWEIAVRAGVDVDGFECDILRGASTMLRDTLPTFVMELALYVLEEAQ